MKRKEIKYVALLRGINVVGHNIIRMEDLRKTFKSAKYNDVSTYIQSGNVIFAAPKLKTSTLREKIEGMLLKKFGNHIVVVVKTIPELEEIVERNPFSKMKMKENEKLHVTFLPEVPQKTAIATLEAVKSPVDEIRPMKSEVYILCRNGYGKSLFSNTFIEKKLGVPGTTRNWNTVNKLIVLANTFDT